MAQIKSLYLIRPTSRPEAPTLLDVLKDTKKKSKMGPWPWGVDDLVTERPFGSNYDCHRPLLREYGKFKFTHRESFSY